MINYTVFVSFTKGSLVLFQESAEASESKVTEMTSAVAELQKLLKQASDGKICVKVLTFAIQTV